MKILTLGPSLSYSDVATKEYCAENCIEDPHIIYLTPQNKTEGIIEELVRLYELGDRSTIAIVPIFNSVEGRVKDTIGPGRGLVKYHDKVKIYHEYILDVHHCLASKSSSLGRIRKVYSHPQALGQCGGLLRRMRFATYEESSTSRAAQFVGTRPNFEAAAICSPQTAKAYGLNILLEDIADKFEGYSKNQTRFVVLSHKDNEKITGNDKTTVTMEILGQDKPKALYRVLGIIGKRNNNLSYIESMTKGSLKEFVFWMDIDEHRKNLKRELKELRKLTKWLYVHGSYPNRIK